MTRSLTEALEKIAEVLEEGRKALPQNTIRRRGKRAWVKGPNGWKVLSNSVARAMGTAPTTPVAPPKAPKKVRGWSKLRAMGLLK